jgi:hypothetical protein
MKKNPTSDAFEKVKMDALSKVPNSNDRLDIMKIKIEGETKETTSTGGASGAYEPALSFSAPKLTMFSDEAPKKTNPKGGKVKSGEFKEATGAASAGQYSGPSFLAKSQGKKDWRGAAKPLYKGGKFVRVKKKCKTFPYCNQGDIKALDLWEDDKLKEAIKNVAKSKNIHENVVRAIILHEIEEQLFTK